MNSLITLLVLAVSVASVLGGSDDKCPSGTETFHAHRDLSCIPNVDDYVQAALNNFYKNGEDLLKSIGLEIVHLEEKHFTINPTKKVFAAKFGPSTFKSADGSNVVAQFTFMGKGTPQGIENRICGCEGLEGANAESFCDTFLRGKIEARLTELARVFMVKGGVDESQCAW